MSDSSERAAFPVQGRLLGIDFGTRRVGLAVSNPEQTMAGALEIIPRSNSATESRRLKQVVQEYRIVGIVVGLLLALCSLEFVGPNEREGWQVAARLTPVVYVVWSLWLVALGVALHL